MKYKFNDGSELTLDNVELFLGSVVIKLYTGSTLPTMTLVCQYGNDNNHYELGSEVKGSLSLGTAGKTYTIDGYVYSMKEGPSTTYEILLRPLSYTTELLTDTYSSIKSALESLEKIDISASGTADGEVHAFSEYGVNLIDRLASGYVHGIYGRSIDKLIFREFKSPAEYEPDINNIVISGVVDECYNKFISPEVSTEGVSEFSVISGMGSNVTSTSTYNTFYENLIKNKKFNFPTKLSLKSGALIPLEPGMVISTTKINNIKNIKVPDIMYVMDVIITINGGNVEMEATLAGDSKQ